MGWVDGCLRKNQAIQVTHWEEPCKIQDYRSELINCFSMHTPHNSVKYCLRAVWVVSLPGVFLPQAPSLASWPPQFPGRAPDISLGGGGGALIGSLPSACRIEKKKVYNGPYQKLVSLPCQQLKPTLDKVIKCHMRFQNKINETLKKNQSIQTILPEESFHGHGPLDAGSRTALSTTSTVLYASAATPKKGCFEQMSYEIVARLARERLIRIKPLQTLE